MTDRSVAASNSRPPIHILAQDTDPMPMESESFLAGRRILVVEDEMLVMMDAEEMLSDLGCEAVFSASTIDSALALIAAERFDAVLLDLNLGGDRSFAVADALAARRIPFVFATGYGAHGLREQDSGRPVLTKPYSCERLARSMMSLLAV